MKKIPVLFCICLLYVISASSDTIVLKNGMRLHSKKVWEENGEIKCNMRGLVVGFPKKDVVRIEKDQKKEERRSAAKSQKRAENDFPKTKNGLEKKKQELDETHRTLLNELGQLRIRNEVGPGSEILKYNEAISKYNEKAAGYEKQRKTFVAAVEAYNTRVEKENAGKAIDKKNFEKMLASWVGHPIKDFVDKWGSPDDTFDISSGHSVYLFVVEVTPSNTHEIYFKTDPSGKIVHCRSGPWQGDIDILP